MFVWKRKGVNHGHPKNNLNETKINHRLTIFFLAFGPGAAIPGAPCAVEAAQGSPTEVPAKDYPTWL